MRQVFSPIQLEDEHTVVIATDDSGPGGACHSYVVYKKADWEASPKDGTGLPVPLGVVNFQKGALLEVGDLNGCFNEDLLVMVLDRLIAFANGPYPCRETSIARTKVEEALHAMKQRKVERTRRGVMGRHVK